MNWKTRGERFETETEFDQSSLSYSSLLSIQPLFIVNPVVASCTTTIHLIVWGLLYEVAKDLGASTQTGTNNSNIIAQWHPNPESSSTLQSAASLWAG